MKRWLGLLLLVAAPATGDERILDFHSDIRVKADGWIEVVETITVRAEGERIRRGIYRDQYTEYRDMFGNRYVCDIEPLTVFRNDEREDFHSVSIDRGLRTYFGHRDRLVAHGVHTYRYRYRANRMLGYFDDYDELYWTVTGFDWAFPIDEAAATVSFEFEVPEDELRYEAYTGPYGSRQQDYEARTDDAGRVHFRALGPLSPVNGLTIVVSWPEGLVAEPTAFDRFGWLIDDNRNLLVALGGWLLLFLYYVPVWRQHGKDPEAGVIIPRYEPPEGFSPASLRYIRQMYYDDKVMTAAVVNLAVKGYLRINEQGKTHSLTKLDPGPDAGPLAAGEKELYDALFDQSRAIGLAVENHKPLGRAKAAHAKSLMQDYKSRYFQTNGYLNLPGIVIALGTTIAALNVGDGPTPAVIAVIVGLFLTMAFFAIIMKRPTLRGRKLLDEMLGFKEYLEVAEKDELNLRNPPEKTPELFEALLPYALALGVDQAWTEKFAAVLSSVRGPDGRGYSPGWYSGSWNPSSLSKSMSAMSGGLDKAISSSVRAPGSSSGSGGGGFSGGGGGGGGGGGW
ncbi:MAG: DUF2207 domain-containing protein [Woeseiaceae bacterium]|nr:DUF2207 domain-containing protein [Woeseiaceae bacterium]